MASELWLPWSDSQGRYMAEICLTETGCKNACEWLTTTKMEGWRSSDWRPVKIPPGNMLAPLGGDGTIVEFASDEEIEQETETLLESDAELLKRLAE